VPPADSKSSKYHTTNRKLPPPEEELIMLQALLADRFRLAIHEENKEGPVYALVVGSQGPKLSTDLDKEAFPVVTFVQSKPGQPDLVGRQRVDAAPCSAPVAGT
jgi:uncharacterized protein (TIGR03435 family)